MLVIAAPSQTVWFAVGAGDVKFTVNWIHRYFCKYICEILCAKCGTCISYFDKVIPEYACYIGGRLYGYRCIGTGSLNRLAGPAINVVRKCIGRVPSVPVNVISGPGLAFKQTVPVPLTLPEGSGFTTTCLVTVLLMQPGVVIV